MRGIDRLDTLKAAQPSTVPLCVGPCRLVFYWADFTVCEGAGKPEWLRAATNEKPPRFTEVLTYQGHLCTPLLRWHLRSMGLALLSVNGGGFSSSGGWTKQAFSRDATLQLEVITHADAQWSWPSFTLVPKPRAYKITGAFTALQCCD